ncbi:MAG: alcohol dehydrogenase catalytic domain-containing protein [Anaerolineae bacterium]|nr:alcohol dehydrogenase catalytic domain-containing protein [Anaerolineae bacterium]
MLAAIYRWESGFQMEEMVTPRLGPGEALIQVHSCGICASDIKFVHSLALARDANGHVLGHEFSGTVAEVGPDVASLAVGDKVAVEPVWACGSCYECRRARPQHCSRQRVLGFSRPGAYAQYVAAPAVSVYPLPAGLPLESAALAEPLACALHAVELSEAGPGDTAAVIGMGSLGLLMLQLFKMRGVAVAGLGTQPQRLQLARELGADEVIDVRSGDPVAKVRAWSGGRGVDVVIDAVGRAEIVAQAIRMGAVGATVVLFGIPDVDGAVAVPHKAFIGGERRLIGSNATHFLLPRALALLSLGRVQVAPLITHRYGLDRLGQAITSLERREGGAIKVLIQPSQGK